MKNRKVKIFINEKPYLSYSGESLDKIVETVKPGADILICNGFPVSPDYQIKENDRFVLIKRGEMPASADLEAFMTARHTPGVHTRLKNAVVGIAGLGGLGSSASVALARIGIGTLILADFDVVEPSNLNRQQYFIRHIGEMKCSAMQELLKDINPYVKIESFPHKLTPKNIPEVFSRVDVILECFDKAEEKAMLLETAAESFPDKFIIGASGLAGYGDSNRILSRRWGNRIFLVGDLVSEAEPGRGLMAPRVGIAAHHQANLAVELILSPGEALRNIPEISSSTV